MVQTLETWGHTDVVLHADGEPVTKSLVRSIANARVQRTLPRHGPPYSHQSQGPVEACIQVYRGIFVTNKLALETGIGCRLSLKHPAIVWQVRHVAWLITRYNTGRDGCSPYRRIFGKSYDGSICKFGEQVHYKLRGHPSSRVEPRWELGAWVGKTELTDEHLLGTLSGIRNSRTIYRLPKSHCYSKDALDRIVGTPANPKPHGTVRDPVVRRQYITQRWVDEHGVTPGYPRCEGRGTMSHSETCRKRFEGIEKKKLDKQLEEESAKIPEFPPERAVEMEVEQPQEQLLTGGASSSSGPAVPVQEAAAVASPSSHEVRMDVTESSSTRPLEEGDESLNKRARNLSGMLLFDENDTSDWQEAVWETQLTGTRDEPHELETVIDQCARPDTDVPGVWRCQVEPRSDLCGDRTGKLLNPEKVINGRLTELKHMNDHHVYDWIDEADIPKGTKVETSRWLNDLQPRDGDENHVRSRIVVQQFNVGNRHDVHQGTPLLKVLRMLLALATSKDAHRRMVCGIWDVSVAFFHSPMDEFTVVRPPVGLRVRGKLWVQNRALYATRMASRCFGKLSRRGAKRCSV